MDQKCDYIDPPRDRHSFHICEYLFQKCFSKHCCRCKQNKQENPPVVCSACNGFIQVKKRRKNKGKVKAIQLFHLFDQNKLIFICHGCYIAYHDHARNGSFKRVIQHFIKVQKSYKGLFDHYPILVKNKILGYFRTEPRRYHPLLLNNY